MATRITEETRRTLFFARYEASRLGCEVVDTPHLLLGILRLGDHGALDLLSRYGLTADALRAELGGGRAMTGLLAPIAPSMPLTPAAERALDLAAEEADLCGSVRLILGLLRLEGGCAAAELLRRHGLETGPVRRQARELAAGEGPDSADATPLLAQFGRDLTAAAARGGFDPLIGRERELQHVMQILLQRQKSNPVLVGEPGVGKTALVEGLAQRIAADAVPAPLRGKRLIALDLGALVAGTKFRGQFEERLQGVLGELRARRDRIVFIDEVHTLVGTGAADGPLDAANLLKPALAHGEVSCIGATTPREYRQYIEKDRALLRRFQKVDVAAPTPEETLDIVEGLREGFETFHGLRYSGEALRAAVHQSVRYLPDRHLPDKAIEVLDQTGARLNLRRLTDQAQTEPVVTRRDVEETIAFTTGIPVARLQSGEAERLRSLEAVLGRRVVGQERAVDAVCQALRRSRLGVRNPRRPIGSFLLVGPSGVGKTELARQLSGLLFDRPQALVRFDMSEYMERHAVAKLIGSPPGYVGYEEGGQLTEAVRRQPYSVVLFDELEKAHPDIANVLLQILEDGRLSDSEGNVVDFTNTVVLMTSNAGSRLLLEDKTIGFAGDGENGRWQRLESALKAELRRVFSPEFLDRLDDAVFFRPLGREDLRAILDLQIAELGVLLAERGVRLSVAPEVKDWLLEKADLTAATGARPLRRTLQRFVQDAVSEYLMDHDGEAEAIHAAVTGGALRLSKPGEGARGRRAVSTELGQERDVAADGRA